MSAEGSGVRRYEWVRNGLACVNDNATATIKWCEREYFVLASDHDAAVATLSAERANAIASAHDATLRAQRLHEEKEALSARVAALEEALREAAAWLSAYQFAFPDGHEKGKRLDKMRADLRSSAAGNGATNVATAAIAKARAALRSTTRGTEEKTDVHRGAK